MKHWLEYFGVTDSSDLGQSLLWWNLCESADLLDDSGAPWQEYFFDGNSLAVLDGNGGLLWFELHDGLPKCFRSTMVTCANPF